MFSKFSQFLCGPEGTFGLILNAFQQSPGLVLSFKNNFLTPDNNYRSIQQIVNRYYELNSYTAGEGGQLVYQHVGEPVLLQSFHVRVLTSEKELAPNIGDDNTVHLQLIKNTNPAPAVAEKGKEKK